MGALLSVLASAMVVAGPQPTLSDELLDRLVGTWVLEGTIGGKATTHDVTAEWVLNHQFVRVHEVSREKDEKGQPAYEAMVFLGRDESTKEHVAIWIDIWGGASDATIGRGHRNGDEIPFLFEDAKSRFHNVFAYARATDTWTWKMDSEEKGKLVPFARLVLKRPT